MGMTLRVLRMLEALGTLRLNPKMSKIPILKLKGTPRIMIQNPLMIVPILLVVRLLKIAKLLMILSR